MVYRAKHTNKGTDSDLYICFWFAVRVLAVKVVATAPKSANQLQEKALTETMNGFKSLTQKVLCC